MSRSWAGIDAIVFTGGIGENSALVRHRVAQRLDFLGAPLDEDANPGRPGRPRAPGVVDIAEPQAPVRLLVIATMQELQMAGEAAGAAHGARRAGRANGLRSRSPPATST